MKIYECTGTGFTVYSEFFIADNSLELLGYLIDKLNIHPDCTIAHIVGPNYNVLLRNRVVLNVTEYEIKKGWLTCVSE